MSKITKSTEIIKKAIYRGFEWTYTPIVSKAKIVELKTAGLAKLFKIEIEDKKLEWKGG